MNETILMLILTAVMGFFMIFGLVGVWRNRECPDTDTADH